MFAAVDSKLAPLNRSKNMCQVSLQLINQAVVDDSAKEVSHALLPLFFTTWKKSSASLALYALKEIVWE